MHIVQKNKTLHIAYIVVSLRRRSTIILCNAGPVAVPVGGMSVWAAVAVCDRQKDMLLTVYINMYT